MLNFVQVTGTGKTYTDHFPVYIRTEITGHYTATGLHEPSCALPSYVPDCQSEWKTYIETDSIAPRNTVPLPQCTQASITGSLCDSLIAAYYKQYTYLGGMIGNPGYQTTNGTSTYWPSTTQFAPGCTLGCQTCAITGETVQLFYWPPTTANLVADGSGTAKVMTAQTNATMVTTVNGTVLTSPTIYISYDKLYASDSCSGIGSTHYNTIIALTNTADLKSLSWDGLEYVGAMYKTVSFTLDDLVKPIPDSVYNKMVRCQASAYAWKDGADHAGVHFGTDFTCDRTGPYAPIIAVPPQVTALDPNWAACTAWYGGLYDPPKALQGAPAIATPTLPNAPITTPAAPASKASETQAAETRVSEAQAPRSSDAVSSREASKTAGNGDIADPKTGGSTSADTRSIGNQADPTPAGGATAADTHSNGDPADPVLSGVDSSIDTNDRGGQTASQFPGGDTSSDTNDSGNQANPASLGDSIFSVTNDRGSQTDSASPGGNNPKDTRGGGSQADFTSPGQGVSGDTNSNDDQADPTLSYEDEPSDNSNNGDRESQVSTSDAAERTSRNGNQVAAPRTTQGVAGAVLSSIGGTATGFNTIDPQGTSSGGSSAHAIATDTNQQGVTATSAKDGPGSEAVATAAVDSGDRTSGSIKNDDEDDSVHSPSVTVHTVNAADGTTVEGIAISAAATGSGQGDAAVIGGHALGAGQAFSTNKVQVSVDSHGSVVLQQPASRTTANLDGEAPPSFNRQGVVITGSGHAVTASQIAIDTYAFGSMTLRAGEQTTLDNGRLVSVGTAGLKVEGIAVTASAISTPTSADFNAAGPSTAEFMVGGKHYTAVKVGSGLYAVGSTTFSTGQSATLDDGAIIGAGTGGLVVDGTTVPTSEFTSLASPASKQVGAVVTAGGKRLTAYADQSHPGIAIVNSQTLSLGGLVVTLDDGEIVTLASKGLVGGTQTAAFSTITKAFGKGVKAGHVVFTDRGHTYTAEENGDERDIAVVDGTTLSLGGSAITLDSGAVVSLGSSGVVADGRTWTFSSMSSVATSDLGRGELDEAVFKASGATYTAVESQGNTRTAVVEGKTLSIDGPRATLDTGALISLGSGGLAVDGSKTMAFSSASGPQMTGSPRADSSPMASSEQTAGYGLTSTSIAASSIPTSENGCRSAARNLFSPCVAVLLTVLTLVCT